MSKISVALCTYNGSRYVATQLKSIVGQTLPPDEIIICDDGSTDNTLALIDVFTKECAVKISVHKNANNLGIKDNFEKAMRLCSGDIIFLADQDDVWMPEKVQITVSYFLQHPYKNVVFTNGFLLHEDLPSTETIWGEIGFTNSLQEQLKDDVQLLQYLMYERNLATGAAMAVRRSALAVYLPFKNYTGILHDYMLALKAAAGGHLGYIPDCLMYYRIHDSQQVGFRQYAVPLYLRPFYNIPFVGIKAILARRVKRFKKVLAAYLLPYAKDHKKATLFLQEVMRC